MPAARHLRRLTQILASALMVGLAGASAVAAAVIYTAFVVPDVSLGGRLYFNAARIETRCALAGPPGTEPPVITFRARSAASAS